MIDDRKNAENHPRIEIAMIADRAIEIGLHVTLYSILHSLASPESSAIFHLFLKDYNSAAIDRIHKTLNKFEGRYTLHLYDVRIIDSIKSKGVYGNKMTVARIHIPNVIDAEKFIILDADLLVLTDLGALFSFPLDEKVVGAVSLTLVKYIWHKERGTMMSFGLPDTARYLNVGVMLINTRKWKENNYTEKGFTLINRYPERIFCVDQTVLNIILYNQVVFLPDKFNVPFYTREPVVDLRIHRDMVCHFVDSPKPWDFGGEFIHASFPAFKQFLKKTYFADYRTYTSFDIDKLKRMLFILIAYPRCFWNARKIKRSLDPNNHE